MTEASYPFDAVAASYDAGFEDNVVTKHLRAVVQQSLLKHFPPGSSVLELACGTGTDAIVLARHGIHITAIDSSHEMIRIARQKAEKAEVGHLIKFHQHDFSKLESLGGSTFTGAFSNFGGLNCAENVKDVVEKMASMLSPGSYFIACLLNTFCLWEMMSFLVRGRFDAAGRRFSSSGIEAQIGASALKVRYYSPLEFAKVLTPWFIKDGTYGLSIFSPSANSRTFLRSYPRLTQNLLRFDRSVRRISPFYFLGDHFVVIARRR